MKILIFTTKFYPFKGGLENFNLELASRLQKRGFEVVVCTFNQQQKKWKEQHKGITIYRLDGWAILPNVYSLPKYTPTNKKIFAALRKQSFDTVLTNTRFFMSTVIGTRFAKKEKIRHIHIEHGNVFVKHNNPLIWLLSRVYEYSIGTWIFKNAQITVGISDACVAFAKRQKARKTLMIPNALDTSFYQKQSSDRTSTFSIPGKQIITYIGRLIYAKGVQDLIKACKGLRNVTLLIVGDGPHRKTLQQVAKEVNVDARFVGTKGPEEIRSILSVTDIFVNPSYSEGLPTSVLEAGSIGLPIIATNVGGTKQIIKHKKTGLLIQTHNPKQIRTALDYFQTHEQEKKRMALEVKKRVKTVFDWDIIIAQWIEVLSHAK